MLVPQPGWEASRAQLAKEIAVLARRAAYLRGARASRERALSRVRFGALSNAAAIRLAEQRFPSVITAPAWRGLRLPAGSRVTRYMGSSEAVVRSADGRGSLAISTGPLVGETSRGRRTALDLALTRTRHGFVPRSSATPLRFPKISSGTIAVGSARDGFDMSLVGAAKQPGVIEHDHVAYGNVYREADAFLEAVPAGIGAVELSFQLRGPASPRTFGLHLHLPVGDTVAVDGARGSPGVGTSAVIERAGHGLGAVTPAVARDAQGRALPVSFSAKGSVLSMHVDAAGPVSWPVLVDPIVEVLGSGGSTYGATTNCYTFGPYGYGCYPNTAASWSFLTTNKYQMLGVPSSPGLLLYGTGLTFTNDTNDYFSIPAPNSNVYIYAMYQYNVSFAEYPAASYPAYIYNVGSIGYITGGSPGAAEPGRAAVSSNGGRTYAIRNSSTAGYANPASIANYASAYCAYAAGGDGACGAYQPGLAAGNEAAFAIIASVPQPNAQALGLQTARPVAVVGSTTVLESQTLNPTVTVQHSSPPSRGWVRSYSDRATLTGADAGLGMGSVSLSGPGVPNGRTTQSSSGTGTFGQIVPTYRAMPSPISYTAPDGVDNYTAEATDVAGNAAPPVKWTAMVDGTPPTVNLDVRLVGADGKPLSRPSYGMKIDATDDGPDGTQTSGVQKMVIKVDPDSSGNSPYPVITHTNTGCTAAGCPQAMDYTWTMQSSVYGAGQHTVEVDTTDAAGNTDTETVPVTLGHINRLPS